VEPLAGSNADWGREGMVGVGGNGKEEGKKVT